jgi:hypothetical protein
MTKVLRLRYRNLIIGVRFSSIAEKSILAIFTMARTTKKYAAAGTSLFLDEQQNSQHSNRHSTIQSFQSKLGVYNEDGDIDIEMRKLGLS